MNTRMTRWALNLVYLAIPFIPGTTQAAEVAARVPTELWVVGDDGLTQRFAHALRETVDNSHSFSPALAGDGALIMTIPSNLYWRDVNGKTNFQFVVIFTDKSSKYLGVSIGACWENDMSHCASRVMHDAEAVWGRSSGA